MVSIDEYEIISVFLTLEVNTDFNGDIFGILSSLIDRPIINLS